jgi:hypothetical protein
MQKPALTWYCASQEFFSSNHRIHVTSKPYSPYTLENREFTVPGMTQDGLKLEWIINGKCSFRLI